MAIMAMDQGTGRGLVEDLQHQRGHPIHQAEAAMHLLLQPGSPHPAGLTVNLLQHQPGNLRHHQTGRPLITPHNPPGLHPEAEQ